MSDLREALESAIADDENPTTTEPVEQEATPVDAAPVEPAAEEATPTEAAADPAPTETASKTEPTQQTETPQEAQARNRVDRPPQAWNGHAKQVWSQLPLPVRQEVMRREQHVNQVMAESANLRRTVEQFQQAASPYSAKLQSIGLNPAQALQRFLATDHDLSSAPPQRRAQAMAQMIKHYGIDLSLLDGELAGIVTPEARQQDQIEQLLNARMAPVNQLLATIQQQQVAHAEQQAAQAQVTVAQMASHPDFPHFDAVRNTMADIIDMKDARGETISLQEAYRIAVLTNPELAQIEQVRTQSGNLRAQANTAGQAVARAAHAASSVSGAPATNTPQVDVNSLTATIEAAMSGRFR